ncbi:MAG: putative GrpE heat shock protein [Mycobacterium sp.]|jgi:molecular chaperone GrpE|nr:putative GrpE heat shock protein [Mycobacterium sp.]MCW2746062.1 putative GrpE heat shock protein [Mycobacterium sp.]
MSVNGDEGGTPGAAEDREVGDAGSRDAGPPPSPGPDWEDRWRRTAADLDNVRKRQAQDVARARTAERGTVAAEWLPVLDNLELALTHAEADPATLIEGIRAVRDQAVALLGRLGYTRQAEVGVPFDPTRHEVVTVVDQPDSEPGTVVQVLRPGYGGREQQLRPGAVAVARRPE